MAVRRGLALPPINPIEEWNKRRLYIESAKKVDVRFFWKAQQVDRWIGREHWITLIPAASPPLSIRGEFATQFFDGIPFIFFCG
jgi:hypothetical protein